MSQHGNVDDWLATGVGGDSFRPAAFFAESQLAAGTPGPSAAASPNVMAEGAQFTPGILFSNLSRWVDGGGSDGGAMEAAMHRGNTFSRKPTPLSQEGVGPFFASRPLGRVGEPPAFFAESQLDITTPDPSAAASPNVMAEGAQLTPGILFSNLSRWVDGDGSNCGAGKAAMHRGNTFPRTPIPLSQEGVRPFLASQSSGRVGEQGVLLHQFAPPRDATSSSASSPSPSTSFRLPTISLDNTVPTICLREWMEKRAGEEALLREEGRLFDEQQSHWRRVLIDKTSIARFIVEQSIRFRCDNDEEGTGTPASSDLWCNLENVNLDCFAVLFNNLCSVESQTIMGVEMIRRPDGSDHPAAVGNNANQSIVESVRFHHLGALLYELFAGVPPFRNNGGVFDGEKKDPCCTSCQSSPHSPTKQSSSCIQSDNALTPALAFIRAKSVLDSEEKGNSLAWLYTSTSPFETDPIGDVESATSVLSLKRAVAKESASGDSAQLQQDRPSYSFSKRRQVQVEKKQPSSPKSVKFTPLLELGLPQPICALVRNLLKSGLGNSRTEDTYSSLESVLEDLIFLLDDVNRFSLESLCNDDIVIDDNGGIDIPKGGRSLIFRRDKLYGRTADVSALMDAYHRVAKSGRNEAFLISGFSGSGKSEVVKSIFSPVTVAGGYVLTKKLDQFKQQQPLAVVLSAFNELWTIVWGRNTPTENQELVNDLVQAFGPNLLSLARVLPNLSAIAAMHNNDGTSDAPSLGIESNFSGVCFLIRRFMSVITSNASRPVVFFLDDLQWGDDLSFDLIQAILVDTAGSFFFFIGAYRDNEVEENHAFFRMLHNFLVCNLQTTELHLDGVREEDLNSILSNALCHLPSLCKALSKIIYHKTKGNPLFTSEFLKTLVDRGLMRYSFRERKWTWDVEKICAENITENVLHLLTSKMHVLSEERQLVMKTMSCFGMQIGPAIISQLSNIYCGLNVVSVLDCEVAEGFLDKVESEYRFSHDNVREAAYGLINLSDRCRFHHTLGLQMYESSLEGDFDEPLLFIVTDHINYGVPNMVDSHAKRISFARLNLKAGMKSMECCNITSACFYFGYGIALLPCAHWESNYQLSLELFRNMTKAAFLCGNQDKLTLGTQAVLRHARCLNDKLDTYRWLMKSNFRHQLNYKVGLEVFQEVMDQLGEKLSLSPSLKELAAMVAGTLKRVNGLIEAGNLSSLDTMKNERLLRQMHFYDEMILSSYISSPSTFAVVACRMVDITLKHGLCEYSASGFSMFGSVLRSGLVGDAASAYKVGKLSLLMLKQFDGPCHTAKVYAIFYGSIAPPFEAFQICADMCQQGCEMSMATGDSHVTNIFFLNAQIYSFYAGENLSKLERRIEGQLRSMRRTNSTPIANNYYFAYRETILSIIGEENVHENLTDGHMKGNILREKEKTIGLKDFSDRLHLNKAITSYWLGHYDRSRYYADKMSTSVRIGKPSGKFYEIILRFYHGLASLSLYRTKPQKMFIRVGEESMNMLRKLAVNSKWNFENKALLLQAELLSLQTDQDKAKTTYLEAIQASRNSKFVHEQGLACELAGNFHVRICDSAGALDLYLQAKKCYAEWGSQMKVHHMSQQIDIVKM